MNLFENMMLAFRAIRSNLLRAILTLLIIAFGIMALVGILTAIDTAIYSLSDNFSRMGANAFSIEPKGDGARGRGPGRREKIGEPITFDQAMDFRERFSFPSQVALSVRGTGMGVVKTGSAETNPNVPVNGIDENYLDVEAYELLHGRNFTQLEVLNGTNKAIIGKEIAEELFDKRAEKALQQTIAVGNIKYRVVGVLASKGTTMGQSGDRQVFIPLLTAKRFYGTGNSNYKIKVAVANATDIDNAIGEATSTFRNVRRLKLAESDDFEMRTSDGLISMIKENTFYFRIAAIAIGFITLIGAAIGLMNIMLVSVTERTREIGICKALGATKRNILIQFLTEAVVICQMGGIIGIILGVLIGVGVSVLLGGVFRMPWMWIGTAVATCTVVGLLSGIYPAVKAAALDPIESLRYE